jgi:hypothetical protein
VSNDTVRDVRQRAEGAAYTAVGIGVLGFQQAQVRRRAAQARLIAAAREAREQAASISSDARAAAASLSTEVRERVEPVVNRLGDRVDPLVADVRAQVEPVLERLGTSVRRAVGGEAAPTPAATSTTKAAASKAKTDGPTA